MRVAATLLERMVKDGFETSIAMEHFKKDGLVFPLMNRL